MIIASQPRSGTHMTRTALNQHPELEFQSEVLNGIAFSAHWPQDITLDQLLRNNPNFCMHVYDPIDLEGMWPGWEMQAELQERFMRTKQDAMVLTRRDKLAQAISYIEATMSGQFHTFEEPNNSSLTHCPSWAVMDLIDRFERADAWTQSALPDAPVYLYEDLAMMPDAVFNRMQKHLGVTPRPLRAQTKKLGNRPLHKRVRNWDLVEKALMGTRHEHYLEGHRVCH